MSTTTDSDSSETTRNIERPGFCFGDDCFPREAVRSSQITRHQEGSHLFTTALATVVPPDNSRWDYHAETALSEDGELIQAGICLKSKRKADGSVEFSLHDLSWEFGRAFLKNIRFFGMSSQEIRYWLPQLTGLVRGAHVSGLKLDTELRPFLYAVPLKGLSSKGRSISFAVHDLGVTSGKHDDIFEPLLAQMGSEGPESVWHASVPKAFGVVFARDMLQAESYALDRARFAADLIGFALRAGISHFETRYESKPLMWDAEMGRSVISLHPCILLREAKTVKGWIRSIPLIENQSEIGLEDTYKRINSFGEHFLSASRAGDIEDQTGQRALSGRERKLSTGIQRSLRWLGIASDEGNINDRFIATWIALESILDSIEYPGVFEGDRKPVRDIIRQKIREISLPNTTEELLTISADLLEGRLLQNQWPLRKKLDMFAKACGIELRRDDSLLVRDLQYRRGKILHAGRDDSPVSSKQLRQLEHLVERLVAAASVGGYEDLEDGVRHQLQIGQIGSEGGAAPLFLDGRRVPYSLRLVRDQKGLYIREYIVDGKIYSEKNADMSRVDDG